MGACASESPPNAGGEEALAQQVRDRLRLLGSRYRDEERLEQWFEALDVDGDGLITRAEFFVLAMQEAIARSAGERTIRAIGSGSNRRNHAHVEFSRKPIIVVTTLRSW